MNTYIYNHTHIYIYILYMYVYLSPLSSSLRSTQILPYAPPDPQEKICLSTLSRKSLEKVFTTSATGATKVAVAKGKRIFSFWTSRKFFLWHNKFPKRANVQFVDCSSYGMLLSKHVPRTQLVNSPESFLPGTQTLRHCFSATNQSG